jgi:formylglycine-generating enzyme
MAPDACCTPENSRGGESRLTLPGRMVDPPATLVTLPEGRFCMGDTSAWAYPGDGEGPLHDVDLGAFSVDRYAVSNARFAEFVASTGYRTDAERFGWSFVFSGLLPHDFDETRAVAATPWWRQVYDAEWQHPEGPQSAIEDRMDHPVVHVSWNDAQAYCSWSGTRLPTEAEWEYAARGGVTTSFPWGDDLEPGGEHRMNVFQGTFPAENTGADGYVGTAPVDAYPPNGFGLYNVTGNVWEWCSDRYAPAYYAASPIKDPLGPDVGARRVMRGGSYICHISYCRRYRVAARQSNEPESSTGNLGFRVVDNT